MIRKNWFFALTLLMSLSIVFIGCDKDDDDNDGTLKLNISGLENLGSTQAYEGWIIVNGNAISTGVFDVDDNGNLSSSSFDVDQSDLDNASTFVLTIEPSPDSDPAPSSVHILAGDISNGTGSLNVEHPAALGDDFANAAGTFILATPTNGMMTDEKSGVWFLDLSSGMPMQGLTLPTLPSGWVYEGWAVINGQPVTSGRFTELDDVDDFAGFSGAMPGPPFPGEDYLENAPSGLTFPLDLSGSTMVISIEPEPDNSPLPFTLKPLAGDVPTSAADHFNYNMNNISGSTFPTGSVTIE